MNVGIVCGYDLDSELLGYVARLAPHIEREKLDVVILSGGRTSPHRPDSEAEVMRDALSALLRGVPMILEEEAMTTLDNLTFGREVARSLGTIDRYVVFCDNVHRIKVRVLARMLLRARRVISVPRRTPLWVKAIEPASVVCEAIGVFVPRVRMLIRALAMRVKGVSGPPAARGTRRSAPRAAA